jgi:integrase
MVYAQRSRHGLWKYRRAIPSDLRTLAGKREINVTLGTRDDLLAQRAYLKVHGETESYLASLRKVHANPRNRNSAKEASELGMAYMRQIKMSYVPLDELKAMANKGDSVSEYEKRLNFVEANLGIGVGDPDTRESEIDASWKARAILGALPEQQFCITDALKVYLAEKGPALTLMSPKKAKRFCLEKSRVVAYLTQALGGDKPLAELARRDARTFRDFLINRPLSVPTINKYMKAAATVWKVAAQDIELATTNPFKGHSIVDPTPEREKRDPLTQKELATLLARRGNMNAQLSTILTLLAYTGARTNEIAGLCLADVVINDVPKGISEIFIRPNSLRSLKNHSSRRTIPLLGEALDLAKTLVSQRTKASSVALFVRYSMDGSQSLVSASLMKHLRAAGITAKTKTIHSLRHTIKQALRDVECPRDVSDAIQGHSSGSASENYGRGHSVKVMAGWLRKAYANIGL